MARHLNRGGEGVRQEGVDYTYTAFQSTRRSLNKPRSSTMELLDTPQTNKPKIMALAREVMVMIVDLVREAHPRTLESLALTNSHFLPFARYSAYRQVKIDISNDSCQRLLDTIDQSGFASAVRFLRIRGDWCSTSLPRVLESIAGMTGLRDLQLEVNCAQSSVLEILRKLPHVRLHTRCCDETFLGDSTPALEYMQSLESCHNLYSLEVKFSFYYAQSAQSLEILAALIRVLVSCKNLRRLTLDIKCTIPSQILYRSLYFSLGE
jgi:hypothetical protein